MPTKRNQPVLFWLFASTIFLLSGYITQAFAAAPELLAAEWNSARNKLVVSGVADKGVTVTIRNAHDSSQVIGDDTVNKRSQLWEVEQRRLSPVPCRVSASIEVTEFAQLDVLNAPADCAPSAPGSGNIPPVAEANGPYTGVTGSAVHFSSAGSTDTDGSIYSYAWDFGNGGTSSDANPNHTYSTAGIYAVTLTVTDDIGDTGNDSTTATIEQDLPPAVPEVSINSTSQNARPGIPVTEQPLTGNDSYKIFGTNDLGMHCGDFDTRISSILPPFNVLHAQVIRRGAEPDILTPSDNIEVIYSAASNPSDPILSGITSAGTSDTISSMLPDGSVYKTNFWDAVAAYDPFYPPVVTPLAPFVMPDKGLPMPNVEELWLGDGALTAVQQFMPGILNPYLDNIPQIFSLFTIDQPFFIAPAFKFGYVVDAVNWFEAAGLPMTAFDDFGRENPWPLYRVQAKDTRTNTILASTDIVVPISGEANCGACHNDPHDGGNGAATQRLYDDSVPIALAAQDTANVPHEISKEWAADLNLVRLHDLKHSTDLETSTPVVCQSCHYTPALDLAQVGPKGPQTDIESGNPSNGRDQLVNKSMSNVMHNHHGMLDVASLSPGDAGYDPNDLMFPAMPDAIKNADGLVENHQLRRDALNETCYQCHPGRRTDCLRGAMANGGMLCQDCHGDMLQVGDDFSRGVDSDHVGNFTLAGDFYTNPATPRVPWANEPGCGSCHTGDAMDNLSGLSSTIVNNVDAHGNIDGIRLFKAYRSGDTKATPIVPTNKRFAENVIEADNRAISSSDDPRIGNPMLYRVSKGHEGVFCEACHGATHGIWPNKSPVANDNVTARQLQGHTGTVTECNTCHLPAVFEDSGNLELTMDGPHGMHPVASRHWNTHHKEARQNGGDNCRTCHGPDGQGTVLSRMSKDRTLECKDNKGDFCTDEGPKLFPRGHVVGCNDCHANDL